MSARVDQGATRLDVPTFLRRQYAAKRTGERAEIAALLADFFTRALSGELVWR